MRGIFRSKRVVIGAVALLVAVIIAVVTIIQMGLTKESNTISEQGLQAGQNLVATNDGNSADASVETKQINPYQKIQIEASNESDGVVVEECSDDNGESIGGVKDGYYTAYYNVDFGDEGANRVVFRVATPMAGGIIEIRLDGYEGTLIGTCEVKTTGSDWHTWVSVGCDVEDTTGIHKVFLVYHGEDYLFNLNWFRFAKGEGDALESIGLNKSSPKVGDLIVATVSPANAIVAYEWLVNDEVVSVAQKYTVLPRDLDKTIQVQVTGLGYSTGVLSSETTWKVLGADYEFNVEEAAYESFTSFIDGYYYYSKVSEYGLFLHTEFWDQAEMYEIVIDAYEHTGSPRYKEMIYDIFKGFNMSNGTDWSNNEYNDDLMWMVIACSRAYSATGDKMFLETAKYHFDLVWDRGWSDDLGGGIWWRTDNQTKNACINCPASIAACLLGEALDDESYYDKSVQIMDWVVANIYEPDTGRVYDGYNINAEKSQWASTYNQGTFIGANTLLYEHFGDDRYINQARLATDYTMDTMYQGGVMSNEDDGGDLIGFKGILCRWMYRFAMNSNQPDILEWLKMNAATAWNNRNKDGLIWTTWNAKTGDDTTDYDVFGLSTGVSLLNNSRSNTNLVIDASKQIEMEAFDLCRGIVTEECSEGGKSIGEIQSGNYTVYHNVDFGDGGLSKTVFRAASVATEGGTVEVRLGTIDGKLIGSCQIEDTGDLNTWKTFTCDITDVSGMQDVYLVFNGKDFLFNLNWFQFAE